ncbi:MAG TPA: type IV secretory system conjugative DNA transfer family protein [Acidimicrobiales bacterium]|nr:type IV secretory system conjugative DNA transfer family protein [Acidimicrobiales bacterium]
MGHEDPFGKLLLGVAAVVGAVGLVVWGGAGLAAKFAGVSFEADLAAAVQAATRLPSHAGDPAVAWERSPDGPFPSVIVYWAATGLVAVATGLLGVGGLAVWQRLQRVGTVQRQRLGVDARAWLARRRDLQTVLVPGPRPGRFILGRFGHRLVATECRATTRPSRRWWVRRRQGDTGAVALVGPSRSGKTVAAVAGILEWEGPAVLSSVKTDLMAATIGWRARRGDVRVYDPLGLTPAAGAGWSPLAQARSITGARRASRNLLEAVADDGTSNLGMWKSLAEYLLAGLFWVAANADRDMAAVVEWVLTQDRPRPDGPSEVDGLLRDLLTHPDPDIAASAPLALDYLFSTWSQDERPRSSIYVTAQAALGAFADPAVSAAARVNEIDLDWLLSGDNTVFICSPLKDQARLAPAFGGLVNDLMTQIYERSNRAAGGRLERRVLVVLDEAGNQRLEQLPEYASTVAGLGVQLVTIWQSVAQITRAYGKAAGIVLTNHLSKVFYTGLSDEDSLNYVAKVLGDEEIESRQLSGHYSALARSTATDLTTRVALVQAHSLRQMLPGDALLVHGTLPPAHIRTRRYYTERHLRHRAELPAPAKLLRPAPVDSPTASPHGVDVLDVFADQRDELLARVDALAATRPADTAPGEGP